MNGDQQQKPNNNKSQRKTRILRDRTKPTTASTTSTTTHSNQSNQIDNEGGGDFDKLDDELPFNFYEIASKNF